MLNTYNWLKAGLYSIFFGSFLTLVISLINQLIPMSFSTSNFFLSIGGLTILLTLINDYAHQSIIYLEDKSFKHLHKSYIATYKVRKFANQMSNPIEIFNGLPRLSGNEKVIKKANQSLQTLTVYFYQDRADFSIKLPANVESNKALQAILKDIRAELNHLDADFSFSDIVHKKGRWYISRARRQR